jgi:hypothetical protein
MKSEGSSTTPATFVSATSLAARKLTEKIVVAASELNSFKET